MLPCICSLMDDIVPQANKTLFVCNLFLSIIYTSQMKQ